MMPVIVSSGVPYTYYVYWNEMSEISSILNFIFKTIGK